MLHEKERKATTVTGSIPGVTAPTITYKKGNETLTAAPADAGDYTASITLGEGENAKTASVEHRKSYAHGGELQLHRSD